MADEWRVSESLNFGCKPSKFGFDLPDDALALDLVRLFEGTQQPPCDTLQAGNGGSVLVGLYLIHITARRRRQDYLATSQ